MAAVLTLVQTKQIRINIHKRNNTKKNRVQTLKETDEEQKTNLMSLATLFHFLCAQDVSDINISIIRSLRLFF